jgi:hypothetical protein
MFTTPSEDKTRNDARYDEQDVGQQRQISQQTRTRSQESRWLQIGVHNFRSNWGEKGM